MKVFKTICAIPATIFGGVGLLILFAVLAVKLTLEKHIKQ